MKEIKGIKCGTTKLSFDYNCLNEFVLPSFQEKTNNLNRIKVQKKMLMLELYTLCFSALNSLYLIKFKITLPLPSFKQQINAK